MLSINFLIYTTKTKRDIKKMLDSIHLTPAEQLKLQAIKKIEEQKKQQPSVIKRLCAQYNTYQKSLFIKKSALQKMIDNSHGTAELTKGLQTKIRLDKIMLSAIEEALEMPLNERCYTTQLTEVQILGDTLEDSSSSGSE